jgi:hypothetical protein
MIAPMPGSPLDRMRLALCRCTFLPGSAHKRFARDIAHMQLDKITEAQWRHVIRLAWRYRRQMPRDLIPSKDAVEAMDAAWNAARTAQERRRLKPLCHLANEQMTLPL